MVNMEDRYKKKVWRLGQTGRFLLNADGVLGESYQATKLRELIVRLAWPEILNGMFWSE